MSLEGLERHSDKISSLTTPQDVEGFFADLVLNDYDGIHLESLGHAATGFGDGSLDPNPARQEYLYAAAQQNANLDVGQLPPR